jgi:hypothetical protein
LVLKQGSDTGAAPTCVGKGSGIDAARMVGRIFRRLSEAQRRTLAAVDERQTFNAVSVAPRISTARRLEAIGLIERGECGLADARLTSLGRAIRAELVD